MSSNGPRQGINKKIELAGWLTLGSDGEEVGDVVGAGGVVRIEVLRQPDVEVGVVEAAGAQERARLAGVDGRGGADLILLVSRRHRFFSDDNWEISMYWDMSLLLLSNEFVSQHHLYRRIDVRTFAPSKVCALLAKLFYFLCPFILHGVSRCRHCVRSRKNVNAKAKAFSNMHARVGRFECWFSL